MKIISIKKQFLQKEASDLYGSPGYEDIPKKHIGNMLRYLYHTGGGSRNMENAVIRMTRDVIGHPGDTVPAKWLANKMINLGLPHLIEFIMPSYEMDQEERAARPAKPTIEMADRDPVSPKAMNIQMAMKTDLNWLSKIASKENDFVGEFEISLILKNASWFDGVRGYQEKRGIPFSEMGIEDKEKALEILNADIANELKKNEYDSEEEWREAVDSAYRAIVYMLSTERGKGQKTTRMEMDRPAPKKTEYVEPHIPEEGDIRANLGIPPGFPVAMPVKKKVPKEYIGPPTRKKPSSKPLNFIGSCGWLAKIAMEDKDFIGDIARHSGRDVRIMSFFYDHAGMGDYMIVRYMDTGLIDRVPANEVEMGKK